MASKTKCRTSNLTGIRKWKFDWLTETIGHYKGCFPLKVKSKCGYTMMKKFIQSNYMWVHHVGKVFGQIKSTLCICLPMLRWSFLKNGRHVWLGVASIFLSLVFEKSLQMAKELVKMIRGTYICGDVFLSYLLKESLVSLVSFRISASRFSSS